MEFVFIQLINGLSWAMLLFLLTAGFTIIFGLMRVINLAHGTYYLLGVILGLHHFIIPITCFYVLSVAVCLLQSWES